MEQILKSLGETVVGQLAFTGSEQKQETPMQRSHPGIYCAPAKGRQLGFHKTRNEMDAVKPAQMACSKVIGEPACLASEDKEIDMARLLSPVKERLSPKDMHSIDNPIFRERAADFSHHVPLVDLRMPIGNYAHIGSHGIPCRDMELQQLDFTGIVSSSTSAGSDVESRSTDSECHSDSQSPRLDYCDSELMLQGCAKVRCSPLPTQDNLQLPLTGAHSTGRRVGTRRAVRCPGSYEELRSLESEIVALTHDLSVLPLIDSHSKDHHLSEACPQTSGFKTPCSLNGPGSHEDLMSLEGEMAELTRDLMALRTQVRTCQALS